jgi:hypothetical protein
VPEQSIRTPSVRTTSSDPGDQASWSHVLAHVAAQHNLEQQAQTPHTSSAESSGTFHSLASLSDSFATAESDPDLAELSQSTSSDRSSSSFSSPESKKDSFSTAIADPQLGEQSRRLSSGGNSGTSSVLASRKNSFSSAVADPKLQMRSLPTSSGTGSGLSFAQRHPSLRAPTSIESLSGENSMYSQHSREYPTIFPRGLCASNSGCWPRRRQGTVFGPEHEAWLLTTFRFYRSRVGVARTGTASTYTFC